MQGSATFLARQISRPLLVAIILALAWLAAAQPARAQSGSLQGSGALVRQDSSDCGNNNVSPSNPSLIGGTVTIAQTVAGATTATVQITRGTPNTTYNFFWKCQRGLGSVQTDANGAGTAAFNFQATPGQVLTFDMYPNGSPPGNIYQSVRITPTATGQGALIRQDSSDCGNNNVSGPVGGTVTIAQTATGATTATVQITQGTPNTTYNFFWKCQRGLGAVQTDASGAGTATFTFQAPVGQVLTFDMYPNGSPPGNIYQSVRITPAPPVVSAQRKSVTQLSATELASLRRGIAQMIAWNSAPRGSAEYQRSLIYWANMHYFFGQGCADVSGLNQPGMTGLTPQAESNATDAATWCTCEHGTVQFLTWHRMYLYYFEQVLQAASGDPSLRLPYWDYETDGHIPAAYRDQTYVNDSGQTVPNPLYIAEREASLNDGTGSLGSNVTSTSSAMQQASYNPFNNFIQGTPHGAVHCSTGVFGYGGYMCSVAAAGNDPIFYTHHSNIDRLYECWLQVGETARLPSDPGQLNTQYSFIDGTGAMVTRRVGDMLTTAQLGYSYAAGGGCPAAGSQVRPQMLQAQAVRPVRTFQLQGATRLNRGVTVVPLRLTPELRSMAVTPPRPGARSMLVIDGLTFDAPPQVLYDVYLQEPGGRRALVGVINFFNRTSPHADHGAAAEQVMLDATEALQTLGGNSGSASLVIEPTTGLSGSTVPEASRRISAAANVRFRSVQIHVVQ